MLNTGVKLPQLAFEDVKTIMERNQAHRKKGLTDQDVNLLVKKWREEQQELEQFDDELIATETTRMEERYNKLNVPVLGSMPKEKRDGYYRWANFQLNGMASRPVRERKVSEITEIIRKYDLNGFCAQELGTNFSALPSHETFADFFLPSLQGQLRGTTAHNKHGPAVARHQQGGCGILLLDEAMEYARRPQDDFRNLGRWTSFQFYANPEHQCRIVSFYQLCSTKPKGLETVYQQTCTYIDENNLDTTPRELFLQDFLRQIRVWQGAGERLIIMGDANDHILSGTLATELSALGLEEATNRVWEGEEPNTYVDGKLPIDGVWVSAEIEITHIKLLNFLQSVGDHRSIILEFSTRSFVGTFANKIVKPVSRRLTTKNKTAMFTYNDTVETEFLRHRIPERMDAIDSLLDMCGYPTPPWLQKRIHVLHNQMDEIRIHAERTCRKLHCSALQFSPTVQYWWNRVQACKRLIKIKKGSNGDLSRASRKANVCEIKEPRLLSIAACEEGLRFAKSRMKSLRHSHKGLRKDHLRARFVEHTAKGHTDKAAGVKSKITQEEDKKMWFFIRRTTRDAVRKAILEVDAFDENGVCYK